MKYLRYILFACVSSIAFSAVADDCFDSSKIVATSIHDITNFTILTSENLQYTAYVQPCLSMGLDRMDFTHETGDAQVCTGDSVLNYDRSTGELTESCKIVKIFGPNDAHK